MDQIEIKLPDLSRVVLEPGDTLLFRTERRIAVDEARAIREHLGEHFPGHDVVVLPNGAELSVVRPISTERCGSLWDDIEGNSFSCELPKGHGGEHRASFGWPASVPRDNGLTTPDAPTED